MTDTLLSVFGKVVEGMNVVQYIESVPKGGDDRPIEAVIVKESGEVQ
jgi:peptidyl-prolyl cis-trans isomerase B (cyclophilin B)